MEIAITGVAGGGNADIVGGQPGVLISPSTLIRQGGQTLEITLEGESSLCL